MSGATITVQDGPTISVSDVVTSGAVIAALGYTPQNAATAFSGAYAALTGKPTLFDGAYASLTGKPTLFSGAYADLSGLPTLGSAAATSASAYDVAGAAAAVSALRAAADGSTFGLAAFTANDFNAASGVISLDYINGQKATASVPGFLSAADWATFNAKAPTAAPTFTTPVLGVASGTSLALGGATIGSNALAVTGTVQQQVAAGSAYTIVGTGSIGGTDNAGGVKIVLAYNATGNRQFWIGSTDANNYGAYLVSNGSQLELGSAKVDGTAGPLVLQSAVRITEPVGSSALTLTGATQTSNFPVINATQTWNNSGTQFTAFKLNVTNTASSNASILMDIQLGGLSKFQVGIGGVFVTAGVLYLGSGVSGQWGSGGVEIPAAAYFGWSATSNATGALDTYWTRGAAATVQQGDANAASPVAQTLRAQGSRAGTDSNVGGANYTHTPGNGTGTGTLSSLILSSPIAVASGTSAQTMTEGMRIFNGTAIVPPKTVSQLPTAAAALAGAIAWVTDATAATFLSIVAGGGANKVPVRCDGTNWVIA